MTIRISSGLRSEIITNYGLGRVIQYGYIQIYDGLQPASADEAPSGVLLAVITQDGLPTPTPSDDSGGLQLVQAGIGQIVNQGEWVIKGVDSGTPGWWRFVGGNPDAGGFSEEASRVDGAVADCITGLPATITPSTSMPMSQFSLTLPPY